MAKNWAKSTLGDRVTHVVDTAIAAKRVSSQNAFARAAGLEHATLSRVANDRSLTAEHRTGDTITKIARMGNVSERWLSSGEGSPDAPAVADEASPDPRYPSKVSAARAMRGVHDDAAIEAMLSEEHRGSIEDPGAEFWIGRIKWWQRERERARAEIGAPLKSDPTEDPPPMVERPKRKVGKRAQ
jgi:transcriptional regulator with XRE-family HTH domain